MDNIKKFFTEKNINIFIIALYFCIVLITVFNHEIWRDEAQAWCLVRDLDFPMLYTAARYEGHPMLWYLLIYPLAKFGLPVFSMQIASFVLVFASVVFFVLKSPFNLIQKFLIVFSAGMCFYLPVIARNYSLIPILVFLTAYLYPNRSKYPVLYLFCIILLSQTHLLMLVFTLLLAGMFFLEEAGKFKLKNKNEKIKSVILFVLLLLNYAFLAFSFFGMNQKNMAVYGYSQHHFTLFATLNDFCYNYFYPVFKFSSEINFVLFYGGIIVILYSFFKYSKKLALIFGLNLVYFLYIFAKVWFGGISYQKSFLLLLILIFCYWIFLIEVKQNYKPLKIAFYTLFAVSLILGVFALNEDIKYKFSGCKQVAQFIRKNLNDEKVFIVKGFQAFSPISAYLPDKKLYYWDENRYITYFNFDRNNPKLKSDFPQEAKYYIVQENAALFKELGYEEIFASDDKILFIAREGEAFKIYKKVANPEIIWDKNRKSANKRKKL